MYMSQIKAKMRAIVSFYILHQTKINAVCDWTMSLLQRLLGKLKPEGLAFIEEENPYEQLSVIKYFTGTCTRKYYAT